MRTIILASVLALFVFSPVMATAAAEASPYRAEADADWAREERTLEFSHDSEGFSYQSHRASDLGEDLIEGEFDLDDALFTYRFISTQLENETTIETEVRFGRLVEYRDMDQDGRYGLGDRPVQTIRTADIEDETLTVRGGVTDDVYRAEVVYPLHNGGLGGVGGSGALGEPALILEFVVAPNTHVEQGRSIQPTQASFEVRVHDFQYQDNDTRLALITGVTSSQALDPAATDVAGSDGFHDVVYRWQSSSSSGILRDVHLVQDTAHGDAAPQNADVIFSYARTQDVGHTASVEAVRYKAQAFAPIIEPLLTGDWRFYSVGILISLAAVAGPAYARLRRDR